MELECAGPTEFIEKLKDSMFGIISGAGRMVRRHIVINGLDGCTPELNPSSFL